MVINYEKKIIFIGIPFSASSAISKELLENYGFEPLFHKHSNVPLLEVKRRDINLDEYSVVAVKRDPVEVCFTSYIKARNNAHNVFEDARFFTENGGHVTKKARRIYKKIQSHKWTFNEYIKNIYRIIPYDSYLSCNKPYINFAINALDMERDFQSFLQQHSFGSKGALPSYNKTENKTESSELSNDVLKHAFGPFIIYNSIPGYHLTIDEVGKFRYLTFLLFHKIRCIYWLLRDIKRSKTRTFTID